MDKRTTRTGQSAGPGSDRFIIGYAQFRGVWYAALVSIRTRAAYLVTTSGFTMKRLEQIECWKEDRLCTHIWRSYTMFL